MSNNTEHCFEPDVTESETAKRWLSFCRSHDFVKCIEYPVPVGILPLNYSGVLIDVKVHGTKRWSGPDDKIYAAHAELRAKVARGNCVLEIHHPHPSKKDVTTVSYLFMVFALRKFSGGMGDEDDCENQNLWQHYFIKPINMAEKVVVTQKANGEAAHISCRIIKSKHECRKIEKETYFCIGSKNVHLLVRNRDDIARYTDSRFMVARIVAEAFFSKYIEPVGAELEEKREDFINFLNTSKYTCVLELLQPNYQHIEDLSHLESPELRFICWTELYSDDDCDTLCSLSPDIAIDKARSYGLSTIEYEVISASDAENYMAKIRTERDYEGKVLYFLDHERKVLGLIKKKTAWYIILRAIREKSSAFTSEKNNNSHSEMEKKVTKRISEIQVWLGFSDTFRRAWTVLGIGFVNWVVVLAKRKPSRGINTRSTFPALWKEYLNTNEEHKTLYSNLSYS